MDQERLHNFCKRVRKFLEETPKNKFSDKSSLSVSEFPGGCCDDTSQVLATLIFDEFGVIPKLCRGEKFREHPSIKSHIWLEIDGIVVDVTLDQFNDYHEDYNFPPVYIGERLDFYNYFEITEVQDGRHYFGCAEVTLDKVFKKVQRGIEELENT